uniref:Uncharacterized protein n=1 Tax=Ditylenchus dipsaci TaxID=166011 RepID=A0A915DNX4_9BILA
MQKLLFSLLVIALALVVESLKEDETEYKSVEGDVPNNHDSVVKESVEEHKRHEASPPEMGKVHRLKSFAVNRLEAAKPHFQTAINTGKCGPRTQEHWRPIH